MKLNVSIMIVIAGLLFAVFSIAYIRFTEIKMTDNKLVMNKKYCRFFAKNSLTENSGTSSSNPVILVPGLKGSALKKNSRVNSRVIWPPSPAEFISVFVGASESELYYSPDVPDTPDDKVIADGIITRIIIIPFLLEYKTYYGIAVQLACSGNGYVFAYDWRAPPAESAKKLANLVKKVSQETGKKPSIVAHSLGGLVTHYYLKDDSESSSGNSEKINKIIYAGVPFDAGIGYLYDINHGSNIGPNSRLLSSEVIFSHPASFALLSHNGTKRYKGKDLMDAQVWKDEKLGIFSREQNTVETDELENELQKLQKVLDETIEFHKVLDKPAKLSNKFLFVTDISSTAPFEVDKNGNVIYLPGDGRVSERSSMPVEFPELDKQVFYTDAGHSEMLNDKKVVQKVMEFLRE